MVSDIVPVIVSMDNTFRNCSSSIVYDSYFDLDVLNGKNNLPERFAEIDIKQVRAALAAEKQKMQKYPEGMAKVFKIPHLPTKLVSKRKKIAAFG